MNDMNSVLNHKDFLTDETPMEIAASTLAHFSQPDAQHYDPMEDSAEIIQLEVARIAEMCIAERA